MYKDSYQEMMIKEKLSAKNIIGIILAISALVLLNF